MLLAPSTLPGGGSKGPRLILDEINYGFSELQMLPLVLLTPKQVMDSDIKALFKIN